MNQHAPTSASMSHALSPSDKERIEAWFDNDARLTDVAHAVGTNVLELAQWADQPHIAAALDAIERIAKRRTQSLRAEAEHAALSRLLSITRFCEQPEIARRAANAILGLARTPKRPARDLKPTDPSQQPAEPLRAQNPDGSQVARERPSVPGISPRPNTHVERQVVPDEHFPVESHPQRVTSPASQPQGFG